jgi:hypothetical protein
LNFYECETEFEEKRTNRIKFKCRVCLNKILQSRLGRTTNLKRHLHDDHRKDSEIVEWLKRRLR